MATIFPGSPRGEQVLPAILRSRLIPAYRPNLATRHRVVVSKGSFTSGMDALSQLETTSLLESRLQFHEASQLPQIYSS